ncbi:MAG: type II secretion system protein [Planctomycetota bacterium]
MGARQRGGGGFTLIELLVVLAIMSMLGAIFVPVLGKVRYTMRTTRCAANTRQTTWAESMYANDNNGRFAETYATIWSPLSGWLPYDPPTLVNADFWPREHRNQSGHFREYFDSPRHLDCSEAPGKFPALLQAWQAGEDWAPGSWLMARKCFWRNWKGLSDDGTVVEGPKTTYQRDGGKVLISCLLNYGRGGKSTLMSSSHFRGAHREDPSLRNNFIWPDFWIGDVAQDELETAMQNVRLQAGYVDGHVDSRNASDTMGVWVKADPFWPGLSLKGKYFLPLGGLR